MKKFGLTLTMIVFITYMTLGQTNAGFENGDISGWADNGTGTESISSLNTRTGNYSLSYGTNNANNQRIENTQEFFIPINQYLHVIAWAVGSNNDAMASLAIYNGIGWLSSTSVNIGLSLTQISYSRQNTSGSNQNGFIGLNSRKLTNATILYWDDVVAYVSPNSEVDIIQPISATGVTSFSSTLGTSITINWIDGTDENSGINQVLILRSNGLSQIPPSLNAQARYSIFGGNNGPNTIGSWSVVGIVNPGEQTFVDNSISPNIDYTYAVYMMDVAYNYSNATTSNITALPVELTSFSASSIGSTVKLNWRTETEVNNYGFEIERYALSAERQAWEKIGFVNGNGNSNSPKSYSYEDKNVTAGKYSYRLKQIDNDGQFEYSKTIEVDFGTPGKFELAQNFPNPFNPITTIRFNLPEASLNPSQEGTLVKLTVYNILGQQVAVLVNDIMESGVHTINFDASELNSGMYIYKIEAGTYVQTRKMTLVK